MLIQINFLIKNVTSKIHDLPTVALKATGDSSLLPVASPWAGSVQTGISREEGRTGFWLESEVAVSGCACSADTSVDARLTAVCSVQFSS